MKIIAQSIKSGERKELVEGHTARYLPSGHLVFIVDDSLYAASFDLKRLEVAGPKIPVVEGVLARSGAPQYAVSDSGTLVYIPGTSTTTASDLTLVWVDRNGKEEPIMAQPDDYGNPRISSDGTRVALGIGGSYDSDVWIWDFARKTMTRMTFDKGEDACPVWDPEGKRIAFHTHQKDARGSVYWKAADNTGTEEAVGSFPGLEIFPWSWSSDGKILLVRTGFRGIGCDIGALSMEGDHEYRPVLQEAYDEIQPKLSPDGRWMAYTSNETGQPEVFVHSFPELDEGRWQVSSNGGESPLWSPDGRELFYRNDDAVMAVTVRTEPTFSLETAKVLFRGNYYTLWTDTSWDIHPDGKSFLMMKSSPTTGDESETVAPGKINIILNWFEELKDRVPTD